MLRAIKDDNIINVTQKTFDLIYKNKGFEFLDGEDLNDKDLKSDKYQKLIDENAKLLKENEELKTKLSEQISAEDELPFSELGDDEKDKIESIENMTVAELKTHADSLEIKYKTNIVKDKLIEKIFTYESFVESISSKSLDELKEYAKENELEYAENIEFDELLLLVKEKILDKINAEE